MTYFNSPDNKARFALGELGVKNLVVFGVNPSTATDLVFDRTTHKVKRYSLKHGFNGWLILNLYPQRSTNPSMLDEEADFELHAVNMKKIEQVLGQIQNFTLCAAWGNAIQKREYLHTSLACINELIGDRTWHSIGPPTKRRHPRHPLYANESSTMQSFDMIDYITFLKTIF